MAAIRGLRPERPMSAPQPNDPLVVFSPSGRRGRFPAGTSVLDAARHLGVDLDSVCGGRALCGRCQVEVVGGELPKHGIVSGPSAVSAEGDAEQRLRSRGRVGAGRRLGCQARILADVAVDVPPDSQAHHQVVRKPTEAHDITIDPVVRACYVEVARPDMADPTGDLQRLFEALRGEWQLDGLTMPLEVLQSLQPALRRGDWRVTVAVREECEVVAVWPGFRDRLIGAAVDVGSTTIAVQLCDLVSGEVLASAGRMNPQIRFGEDLMSRVSYVMMNPGGERELTRAVRSAIGELVAGAAASAGVTADDIVEMTVVGNPVMHHLLLGLSPVELGTAPFALASDAAASLPAVALELDLHPGARVYALPCIAGHVGADAAAVLLAEAPWERDELTLIVDVGTNAELILGNRHRLLAASSPTGPAFEGAQVSCGQRAAPGAIERVRIDRDTLEPRFKVIGCDLWSDEPGFSEGLPRAGVTGVCGSGIIETIAEMFLAGLILPDGTIPAAMAERTQRIVAEDRTFAYVLHAGPPELRIRQEDVRAIQLAKAALYAGARLLMARFGADRLSRIRLAGAFGSHIDVKYAMVLGMIPDAPLAQVSSAGNAAGTGARIALLDRSSRAKIEARVRQVEKVETAIEPDFQRLFVEAMALPHRSDEFVELARVVDLPSPAAAARGGGRRRGRR
jgi:uncharacterized 2Fe-2S/4Fe-4S cluster protein (DUF4445 family)